MAGRWSTCTGGYELASGDLQGRLRLDRPPPGLTAVQVPGWQPASDTPECQLALGTLAYRTKGRLFCLPVGRAGCSFEHVQRRDAVVVTYSANPECNVRLSAHWHAGTSEPLDGRSRTCPLIDLHVEAQTDGKLGDFECLTRTTLQAEQVLVLIAPGASQEFVELRHWMPPGVDRAVFPRDAQAARLSYDGRCPELGTMLCGPTGVAPLVVWRLPGGEVSYLEMCHVQDAARLVLGRPAGGASWRTAPLLGEFGLFGQDLEKGVILRGRLRGVWLARQADLEVARELFHRFLEEPPPLAS